MASGGVCPADRRGAVCLLSLVTSHLLGDGRLSLGRFFKRSCALYFDMTRWMYRRRGAQFDGTLHLVVIRKLHF